MRFWIVNSILEAENIFLISVDIIWVNASDLVKSLI